MSDKPIYYEKDFIGMKFNHVTVVSRNKEHKGNGKYYNCICDCGRTFVRRKDSIYNPQNKTCGFCMRERHGDTGTRLYEIYQNMKARCYYEHSPHYDNYGGRGITVCKDWLNSYNKFKKWALEHGYEETLTLDRINTNGNYEPSNCRWATRKQQSRNLRNNHLVSYNGIYKPLSEWCEILGINKNSIRKRLVRTNDNLNDALALPKGFQYNHKKVNMYNEDGMLLKSFDSPTDCANFVGSITNYKTRMSRIHDVCVGRRNKAYGYIFKYADKEVMPNEANIV